MVFSCIFIGEAILKIIAYGFIMHPNSYLRSGWNIIDAIVVVSAIIELCLIGGKLKSMRILRILRPLKTINALPGMRKLINALLNSLPEIANVLIFLIFIFILFATVGLHQYNGQFYNACRVTPEPLNQTWWETDVSSQRVCSINGLGNYQCPQGYSCRNPQDYPEYEYSQENMELRGYVNYGITNFDHLGSSFLSVFQIITSDTWYQQLCNFMDTDLPVFGLLYCILMIIVGQFFMLNLFLAVIVLAFVRSQNPEVQLQLQIMKADEDRKAKELAKERRRVNHEIQMTMTRRHRIFLSGKRLRLFDVDYDPNHFDESLVTSKYDEALQGQKGFAKKKTKAISARHIQDIIIGTKGQNRRSSFKTSKPLDEEQFELSTFIKQKVIKRKIVELFKSSKNFAKKAQLKYKIEPGMRIEEASQEDEDAKESSHNRADHDVNSHHHHSDIKISAMKRPNYNKQSESQSPGGFGQSLNDSPKFEPLSQNNHAEIVIPNKSHNKSSRKQSYLDASDPMLDISEEESVHIDLRLVGASNPSRKELIKSDCAAPKHQIPDQKSLSIQENFDKQSQKVEAPKVEKKYDQYFRNVLKDAVDKKDPQKSTMRELVGLKVGLEYIKQAEDNKTRAKEEEKNKNDRRKVSKLYLISSMLAENIWFTFGIGLAIILNTLILSLDKYPEDVQLTVILEKLNIVFAVIFTIELIVKLLAFGFKSFFTGSLFNHFDSLIVLASLVDIIISNIFILNQKSTTHNTLLTILRGIRLLRIFKLAKQWRRFELLLETLAKSLKDISNFSFFLFLFIFIFALVGLELFASKVKVDPESNEISVDGVAPIFNFDNFLNSISTVFIILTNDGQAAIYYNYYRGVGWVPATIFFVLLVILGQKIILNLFVAILLENFDEGQLKLKLHDYEEEQSQKMQVSQLIRDKSIRIKQTIKNWLNARFGTDNDTSSTSDPSHLSGVSLFLFPPSSRFRRLVGTLVASRPFDLVLLCLVLVTAVQLAMDRPLLDPATARILYWVDFGTTIAFSGESALKSIAQGFISNGKGSYARDRWNQLDMLIIGLSILALTPLQGDLKAFKVLRILRILNRNENLKLALSALMRGIPNVLQVTAIMLLFFLIFGVIFVSQFKGKFFSCVENIIEEPKSKWDCHNYGGLWQNTPYNFDDIPTALVTLFVMSTTAGWQDVLYHSITSTKIDYTADESYRNPIWSIYCILFMIVGYFFFINLFIGVVVANFNIEHDKIGGNDLLTEKQREWIDLKLLVLRSGPIKKLKRPEGKVRMLFYKLTIHKYFDTFIYIAISINTLVLTLKWYQQSEAISSALEILNYIFTSIFFLEALIKLLGEGFKQYFADTWNQFDFIIAFCSTAGLIVGQFQSALQIKSIITLLRAFRIFRIVRLLKRIGRSLQLIMTTFVVTLHSLSNIGSLLGVIIFMYSVLGMILFGTNKRNGAMNDYINFENILNSFITLFVVTTGDSWNAIQTSFIQDNLANSECLNNPSYHDYIENGYQTIGCQNRAIVYAFFVSYTFIVNLIFLQLFIAVILQGYDRTQNQEARLFNNDMNIIFREVWADFDPEATSFISLYQLRDFLAALGEPLGFSQVMHRFQQDKFIASLDLPTYYNFSKYQFLDVLEALSFRVMVKDHIQNRLIAKNVKEAGDTTSQCVDYHVDTETENKIKEDLSQEINKLLLKGHNDHISAVDNMKSMHEKKEAKSQLTSIRDQGGMSSMHHMAAEAAVRRMREFIRLRRCEHYNLEDNEAVKQRVIKRQKIGQETTVPGYLQKIRQSIFQENLTHHLHAVSHPINLDHIQELIQNHQSEAIEELNDSLNEIKDESSFSHSSNSSESFRSHHHDKMQQKEQFNIEIEQLIERQPPHRRDTNTHLLHQQSVIVKSSNQGFQFNYAHAFKNSSSVQQDGSIIEEEELSQHIYFSQSIKSASCGRESSNVIN